LYFYEVITPTPVAVAGGMVFTEGCLFVCFTHNISKTDATRVTKPDIEIFYNDSWKRIYFGVKMSGQGHAQQKQLQ